MPVSPAASRSASLACRSRSASAISSAERRLRTKQSQIELVHLAEQYVLKHIADRVYVTD